MPAPLTRPAPIGPAPTRSTPTRSTLTRRALLRAAFAGLGACAAAGCTPPPPGELVVAAGERGGLYVEFAELLGRALGARQIAAVVLETGGSVENVDRIVAGTATMGLLLSDIAAAARRGVDPFGAPLALCALGRVYENYLQLVVPADGPVRDLADLDGRAVSLGAVGSGAAVFGDRLLAAAAVSVTVQRRPLRAAVEALESGAAQGLLWSGGIPTPALAELAARRPVRLVPLAPHAPALRARYGPSYRRVDVPAGVYGATDPVPTIGVANLLATTPQLPDAVADAVVRTLVDAAPELVPTAALGTQYLDQPSLVDTGELALHPAAAAAYRSLHG